jgi:hypothetical protein
MTEIKQARWKKDTFGEEAWGGDGWSYSSFGQPTHWMPLPEPPPPLPDNQS